jgi:hypothetical protein
MDIVRVDNFARGAVRIAISLFRSLNFVSWAVRITNHFSCDMHWLRERVNQKTTFVYWLPC